MRARRLSRDTAVTLGVGLLAATPVIIATIRWLIDGWMPVGDNAIIAVRSYDVFSSDSPLLGQFSASSNVENRQTHSLGPLLYWLLAVPSRVGSPGSLVVITGVVNTAAVMGTVALARRRGGVPLMILTAGAIVVMCTSLVLKTWAEIWNPSIAILPLMLLAFAAWSIARGEFRLIPLAVLLASFVVQAHLTFVLPTAGLLAVAAVGLWLERRDLDRSALRRWIILAAAVLAVCWSAPVIEQLTERPGNFVQVVRTATADTPKTGFDTIGRDAFVRTVGIPPWWTDVAEQSRDRLIQLHDPVGTPRILSAIVVLIAMIALVVVAARRGRRDIAVAGACSLVMIAGVTAVGSSTPTTGLSGITLAYTLWWASVASMFTWLTLIWGTAQLLPVRWPVGRRRVRATAALAAVCATAAVVALVRAGVGPDTIEPSYDAVRDLEPRLERAVPEGQTVLVGTVRPENRFDDHQFDVEAGSIYVLRRHGAEPVTNDYQAHGERYSPAGKSIAARVMIGREGDDPGPGARVIARPRVEGASRPLVVWLVR